MTESNVFIPPNFHDSFYLPLTPAAHVRTLRVTPVCRGTPVENHWLRRRNGLIKAYIKLDDDDDDDLTVTTCIGVLYALHVPAPLTRIYVPFSAWLQ
jgi:hypothetical protein